VRKALAPELASQDEPSLAQHPAVRILLESKIEAALKNVASWERVKRFVLLPRPFSLAEEEITVSFKLRRNVIFARYQGALDALYQGCEPPEE
jgi:long-chain acyl-CoA synthetase